MIKKFNIKVFDMHLLFPLILILAIFLIVLYLEEKSAKSKQEIDCLNTDIYLTLNSSLESNAVIKENEIKKG